MNTSRFYYADSNSQPVGPLSLSEIRCLIDAGAISDQIFVCEQGTENWIFFADAAAASTASEIPNSQTPPAALDGLDVTDASETNSGDILRLWGWAALVALFFPFVDALCQHGLSSGSTSSPKSQLLLSVFPFALLIACISLEWRVVYRLWQILPSIAGQGGPVRAFGFLLIPLFNFYWAFQVFPILAERAKLSRTLGLVAACFFCVEAFLALIFLLSDIYPVLLGILVSLPSAVARFYLYGMAIGSMPDQREEPYGPAFLLGALAGRSGIWGILGAIVPIALIIREIFFKGQ